jgi:hypothetical protein
MFPVFYLLAVCVSFLSSCSTNKSSKAVENINVTSDTTVIAQAQPPIVLSRANMQVHVNLSTSKVQDGKQYFLQLSELKLTEQPDGAYEVYLSREKLSKSNINSTSNSYVDVLDTYTIASSPARPLVLNVSKQLRALAANTAQQQLVVTILFRGNLAANKIESTDAGNLTIGAVKLIEAR